MKSTAHPYKASKAWHYGVLLADDVEHVTVAVLRSGEHALARRLYAASASLHLWLRDSHQFADVADQMGCYKKARDAGRQLLIDLRITHSLRHIDQRTHDQLVSRTITIDRLISQLIQQGA